MHARTENGLKQYLKRALREGATADEVVDALLMAFPALGLANIVWAIDVILKMELPEFPRDVPARGADGRTRLARRDRGGVCRRQGGAPRLRRPRIFVLRRAARSGSTTACARTSRPNIPDLALEGTRLTCPKHEWAFDVPTGRCVAKGDTPLTLRPHRIEAGRVLVLW